MAENNRNRSSYASDENWDKNKSRYSDDNDARENSWYNPNNMDLDRDGNVGHTGGFYGGTNYMGSSYQNDERNDPNRQDDYPNYQNPNYGYGNRQDNTRYRQQSYGNVNQYKNENYNVNDDYRVHQPYNQQNRNQWRDDRRYSNEEHPYVSRFGNVENYDRRGNDYGYQDRSRNWNDDQYSSRQNDYRHRRNERSWWDKAKDEVSSWFGDDDDDRRSGQGHRGKGPKEYRRSDNRILEDVCDRLYEDSYVDASNVEVKVENGEVTLNGTIESRNARRRAEDIIESISGVSHIQNNLRVGQAMNVGSSNTTSSTFQTGNREDEQNKI